MPGIDYTTTTHENGKFHITVHRPVLTDEERERRMAEIKQAAVDLITATERERKRRK